MTRHSSVAYIRLHTNPACQDRAGCRCGHNLQFVRESKVRSRCRAKGKAPKPKLQAPEKSQNQNSSGSRRSGFGAWFLVLLWSLDFGALLLELSLLNLRGHDVAVFGPTAVVILDV